MGNQVVEIAGKRVAPGEKVYFHLPVAELATGIPIRIPVIVINGQEAGPTFYLQAGTHGDEVTGTEVVRQVSQDLQPADLRGTFISVPIANVLAFLTRSRCYGLEEREINMHSCFPGNPNGFLTEQIAHKIFQEIALKADYSIDLHAGLTGANCYPFTYVIPTDNKHGTLETRTKIARASGFELIYYLPREDCYKFRSLDGFDGNFSEQLDKNGIPNTLFELGEGGRITHEFIPVAVRGVKNVLKHLGMLEGEPIIDKEPHKFTSFAVARPEKGGLLYVKARLGAPIAQGDLIAEVSDGYEVVDEVRSPKDGVLLRLMTTTIINPGAEVAWIAV